MLGINYKLKNISASQASSQAKAKAKDPKISVELSTLLSSGAPAETQAISFGSRSDVDQSTIQELNAFICSIDGAYAYVTQDVAIMSYLANQASSSAGSPPYADPYLKALSTAKTYCYSVSVTAQDPLTLITIDPANPNPQIFPNFTFFAVVFTFEDQTTPDVYQKVIDFCTQNAKPKAVGVQSKGLKPSQKSKGKNNKAA